MRRLTGRPPISRKGAEADAAITEIAPAKVNLALAVTGRRADGYHELDTIVAFADLGDSLTVTERGSGHFAVSGPFAGAVPRSADNLVLRAAQALAAACGRLTDRLQIRLDKQLPVAAGIGGGSADAAAMLRALARLWQLDPAGAGCLAIARRLGADVPMCLVSQALRAGGIGERVDRLANVPPLAAVLVNPLQPVATTAVFARLQPGDVSPLPALPPVIDANSFIDWLVTCRNDLEAPARALAPVIGDVLTALCDTSGCRLARMSGAGATCFGLYETQAAARAAAEELKGRYPHWWIAATMLS